MNEVAQRGQRPHSVNTSAVHEGAPDGVRASPRPPGWKEKRLAALELSAALCPAAHRGASWCRAETSRHCELSNPLPLTLGTRHCLGNEENVTKCAKCV